MIRIHREGRLIIIISVLILLTLNILAVLYLNYPVYYIISFLTIALMVLLLRFFRVPDRRFLKDDRLVIAPADGTIVAIEKTFVNEFLKEERIQLSIFMSIHDVHINYCPVNGIVEYTRYHPGKYLVARHPKSSELNERFSTAIRQGESILLVRQIAGYVARRIKCYVEQGNIVSQGQELGFIKFGSRVDVFLPLDSEIQVSLNQSVTGGVTPIARIK